jgi:hypothetical protein
MLRYFLAGVLIATGAFAISNVCIEGEGAPIGPYNPPDTRDDLVWEQWAQGQNVACGSMWYDPSQDMAVADNFQTDGGTGFQVSYWESYIAYWYGSPNTEKGTWVCIYEDGGSAPATTEPYEFGSSSGWHTDFENGDARDYDDITGFCGGDYWTYGNTDETFAYYLFGYYPCYLLSTDFSEAESGGWVHILNDDDAFYWSFQRYAHYPGAGPYGGPSDCPDSMSPNWFQRGISGASWSYPGYPYGLPLRIYGIASDETPPVITDMYPVDADYPSGVPVDSWAGCHWTDLEEGDVGIKVSDSFFNLYDSDMELLTGMLNVDDADIHDVIVDFEPDDDFLEGATYTAETTCYDLAGNEDTETWDFTTGFVNIEERSFGAIKAGFAQ